MEKSKPINRLPIVNNPKLDGYTIYEDLNNTYITDLKSIYDLFEISSGNTKLYNMITGETKERINSYKTLDISKLDKSDGESLFNMITGETSDRISNDKNLDKIKYDKSGGSISGNIEVYGDTTSYSFIMSGGTSDQYLMADGSVMTTGYTKIYYDSIYVNISGDTIRGNLVVSGNTMSDAFIKHDGKGDEYLMSDGTVITTGDTQTYYDTRYVNVTGDTITGNLNISGNTTSNSLIKIGGKGDEYLMANGTVITTGYTQSYYDTRYVNITGDTISGNLNVSGNTTSNSLIKIGGKGDEYLMSDGTVITTGDTQTYYDTRYVNITGDTISGNLNISGNTTSNSLIKIGGKGDEYLMANGSITTTGDTQTYYDTRYVNVTGDSITGNLNINENLNVSGFTVSNSFIKRNGRSDEFLMSDGSIITTGDTQTYYDTRYVNVTGDTITGNLNVSGNTTSNSFIKQNGKHNESLMADGSVYKTTFDSDFTVQLLSGSFGKYKNGDVVPSSGKTPMEVILDASIQYLTPSFNSFYAHNTNVVEICSTLESTLDFSFDFNYFSNVLPNSLTIYDVTNNNNKLIENDSVSSPLQINVGTVKKINNDEYNEWKASAVDTKSNIFYSNYFRITWKSKIYYGSSDSEIVNFNINSLPSYVYSDSTQFNIILDKLYYTIVLPSEKSIQSIITVNNENITSNFVKIKDVNVTMIDGITIKPYSIFEIKTAIIPNISAIVKIK